MEEYINVPKNWIKTEFLSGGELYVVICDQDNIDDLDDEDEIELTFFKVSINNGKKELIAIEDDEEYKKVLNSFYNLNYEYAKIGDE